jgi:hypothetical protein
MRLAEWQVFFILLLYFICMLDIMGNEEVDVMQAKVVNLFEIKYKNILNINLNDDIIHIAKKKRSIRQRMIKGYMELLSNQINK